jgi:hypothetical protein
MEKEGEKDILVTIPSYPFYIIDQELFFIQKK